jgi:DNA polymerase III sliding clamp (beta) subunit (PCNA family)
MIKQLKKILPLIDGVTSVESRKGQTVLTLRAAGSLIAGLPIAGQVSGTLYYNTRQIKEAAKVASAKDRIEIKNDSLWIGDLEIKPDASLEEYASAYRPNFETHTILSGKYLNALSRAIVFAATEDARYMFNGVYHNSKRGTLEATDGRRAVSIKCDSLDRDAIVPIKVCKLIADLFDASEVLQISTVDTWVSYSQGGLSIAANTIDSKFPDLEQVIPARAGEIFQIKPKAAARLAKMKIPKNVEKHVVCDFAKGAASFSFQPSEEQQKDHGALPWAITFGVEGEESCKFAIVLQYLQDALCKTFANDESVELSFISGSSPLVFRAGDTVAVVMPRKMEDG